HAVADRADLAGIEDPGRDQVELERLAVTDDRVAGVVAALKSDHDVRLLGEQVGDLSLPFVAPLGANYYETGHDQGIMGPAVAGSAAAGLGVERPQGRSLFAQRGGPVRRYTHAAVIVE